MMNLMQYVFTTIKNVIFARKSMCVYTYLSPQQSHSGNSMKQWHIGQNGIKVFLEQCEEQRGLQLSCNSIRSIFLLDLERGSGIYKVWPLKKEASILDIVTYTQVPYQRTCCLHCQSLHELSQLQRAPLPQGHTSSVDTYIQRVKK